MRLLEKSALYDNIAQRFQDDLRTPAAHHWADNIAITGLIEETINQLSFDELSEAEQQIVLDNIAHMPQGNMETLSLKHATTFDASHGSHRLVSMKCFKYIKLDYLPAQVMTGRTQIVFLCSLL